MSLLSNRVLVIEKSAVTRRLVEIVLRSAGLKTWSCSGRRNFMDALFAIQPDLVVLASELSEMDGWDALEQIRSDLRGKQVKVLVLTSLSEKGDWEQNRMGADAVLVKPFRPEDLNSVALELLGSASNT